MHAQRKGWAQPVGQILPRLGFTEHAMLGNPFNLLFSGIPV
jgi:hypothetical protein